MNLTTDPWIPVVWKDGGARQVSLCEAFEHAGQIRDLAVRPHERVALMRMLICIAQAALDGPADYDEWKVCGPRIKSSVLEYLQRWQHAFELLGNGQRFLQVAGLKKAARNSNGDEDEGNPISKLDVALSTGNNTTLFDNAGGSERAFTHGELALMLVTFQCFSPGGRIGVVLWDGQETPGKGSSDHAPCLAGGMAHALLRGDDLSASLHKNLITRHQGEQLYGPDSWGKPVWEVMPRRLADAEAVRNASRTYLGRLVPVTRAIWLADDCQSIILGNGIQYGSYDKTGWREPTATLVVRTVKDRPVRVVLRASVEKAVWRELHALAVKGVGDRPGGPAALQYLSDDDPFDLWVGGLAANQAKLVDTIESVFHIPPQMLHEDSQRVYEHGVKLAEGTERRLRRAVSTYHKELGDNLDRPEMKARCQEVQKSATAQFWTDAERAVPHLLEIAENPEKLGLPPEWYKTGWGKAVFSAMRAAFERTCAHATPRQMRAYALGLKTLSAAPTEQAEVETETEAQT